MRSNPNLSKLTMLAEDLRFVEHDGPRRDGTKHEFSAFYEDETDESAAKELDREF